MPVIDATPDLDHLSLTITAQFAAPVERVWKVYADPRQLEKVWGPPSHPATVVAHSLTEGGAVHYFMTGPDGQKYYGWWQVTAVDEPHGFEFDDGFASDESFEPTPGMPLSHNVFRLDPADGGTRLTSVTTYDSADALQQVLDMGAVEGATQAINQIDDLLAA